MAGQLSIIGNDTRRRRLLAILAVAQLAAWAAQRHTPWYVDTLMPLISGGATYLTLRNGNLLSGLQVSPVQPGDRLGGQREASDERLNDALSLRLAGTVVLAGFLGATLRSLFRSFRDSPITELGVQLGWFWVLTIGIYLWTWYTERPGNLFTPVLARHLQAEQRNKQSVLDKRVGSLDHIFTFLGLGLLNYLAIICAAWTVLRRVIFRRERVDWEQLPGASRAHLVRWATDPERTIYQHFFFGRIAIVLLTFSVFFVPSVALSSRHAIFAAFFLLPAAPLLYGTMTRRSEHHNRVVWVYSVLAVASSGLMIVLVLNDPFGNPLGVIIGSVIRNTAVRDEYPNVALALYLGAAKQVLPVILSITMSTMLVFPIFKLRAERFGAVGQIQRQRTWLAIHLFADWFAFVAVVAFAVAFLTYHLTDLGTKWALEPGIWTAVLPLRTALFGISILLLLGWLGQLLGWLEISRVGIERRLGLGLLTVMIVCTVLVVVSAVIGHRNFQAAVDRSAGAASVEIERLVTLRSEGTKESLDESVRIAESTSSEIVKFAALLVSAVIAAGNPEEATLDDIRDGLQEIAKGNWGEQAKGTAEWLRGQTDFYLGSSEEALDADYDDPSQRMIEAIMIRAITGK